MKISRITSKYQATVPADVRVALGLNAGDQISWEVEDGVATVRRTNPDQADAWAGAVLIDSRMFGEWLSDEDEEAWRDL